MKYIFLMAGKGSRLYPLTLKMPKPLCRLDKNTTIAERMIHLIETYDPFAEFIIVVGFMAKEIKARLLNKDNIKFVYNPFYSETNSIASLWFAKESLNDEVIILNGDIVMEDKLVQEVVCAHTEKPTVLVDSSIKSDGDYNVQVLQDKVIVMSKNLNRYYGEYAGVTKLDQISAFKIKDQIERMMQAEMYDQWYENALVQMIFDHDFVLYYKDISKYQWTEVDCVDDILLAKKIHNEIHRFDTD